MASLCDVCKGLVPIADVRLEEDCETGEDAVKVDDNELDSPDKGELETDDPEAEEGNALGSDSGEDLNSLEVTVPLV